MKPSTVGSPIRSTDNANQSTPMKTALIATSTVQAVSSMFFSRSPDGCRELRPVLSRRSEIVMAT